MAIFVQNLSDFLSKVFYCYFLTMKKLTISFLSKSHQGVVWKVPHLSVLKVRSPGQLSWHADKASVLCHITEEGKRCGIEKENLPVVRSPPLTQHGTIHEDSTFMTYKANILIWSQWQLSSNMSFIEDKKKTQQKWKLNFSGGII